MIQRDNQKKEDIILVSIDIQKAFDTVNIKSIKDSLEFVGIKSNIIEKVINHQTIYTSNQFGDTRKIEKQNGVIQGESLSPELFKISLEPLFKYIEINEKEIYSTAYVDDIQYKGNKEITINKVLDITNKYIENRNMKINRTKSEVITNTKCKIEIKGEEIMKKETIKVLGVNINLDIKKQNEENNNMTINKIQEAIKVIENSSIRTSFIREIIRTNILAIINYYAPFIESKIGKKIDQMIINLMNKKTGIPKNKMQEWAKNILNNENRIEQHNTKIIYRMINYMNAEKIEETLKERENFKKVTFIGNMMKWIEKNKYELNYQRDIHNTTTKEIFKGSRQTKNVKEIQKIEYIKEISPAFRKEENKFSRIEEKILNKRKIKEEEYLEEDEKIIQKTGIKITKNLREDMIRRIKTYINQLSVIDLAKKEIEEYQRRGMDYRKVKDKIIATDGSKNNQENNISSLAIIGTKGRGEKKIQSYKIKGGIYDAEIQAIIHTMDIAEEDVKIITDSKSSKDFIEGEWKKTKREQLKKSENHLLTNKIFDIKQKKEKRGVETEIEWIKAHQKIKVSEMTQELRMNDRADEEAKIELKSRSTPFSIDYKEHRNKWEITKEGKIIIIKKTKEKMETIPKTLFLNERQRIEYMKYKLRCNETQKYLFDTHKVSNDICLLCKQKVQTIQHILFECEKLTNMYKNRYEAADRSQRNKNKKIDVEKKIRKISENMDKTNNKMSEITKTVIEENMKIICVAKEMSRKEATKNYQSISILDQKDYQSYKRYKKNLIQTKKRIKMEQSDTEMTEKTFEEKIPNLRKSIKEIVEMKEEGIWYKQKDDPVIYCQKKSDLLSVDGLAKACKEYEKKKKEVSIVIEEPFYRDALIEIYPANREKEENIRKIIDREEDEYYINYQKYGKGAVIGINNNVNTDSILGKLKEKNYIAHYISNRKELKNQSRLIKLNNLPKELNIEGAVTDFMNEIMNKIVETSGEAEVVDIIVYGKTGSAEVWISKIIQRTKVEKYMFEYNGENYQVNIKIPYVIAPRSKNEITVEISESYLGYKKEQMKEIFKELNLNNINIFKAEKKITGECENIKEAMKNMNKYKAYFTDQQSEWINSEKEARMEKKQGRRKEEIKENDEKFAKLKKDMEDGLNNLAGALISSLDTFDRRFKMYELKNRQDRIENNIFTLEMDYTRESNEERKLIIMSKISGERKKMEEVAIELNGSMEEVREIETEMRKKTRKMVKKGL